MARIILIGETPPDMMGEAKIEAAHYRTAQFLQPLQDASHEILLVMPQREDRHSVVTGQHEGINQSVAIHFDRPGWVATLQETTTAFKPDCIVAVNFDFCLYASRLRGAAPIWMDIYGDPLTIKQAAAFRAQSDRGLTTVAGFVRQVLRVGDIFSVCGTPQLHMLVGELAMSGRLNCSTFGYEFGRVILPGSRVAEKTLAQGLPRNRDLLSAFGVSSDSFVVLWAGGYNTWTDVNTLFAGLTKAMEVNPRIVFVSVGASTYDGPDQVYERFQELARSSDYHQRFYFLGWRPWTEMESFYRASDIGINIDSLHYETIYGTRTRLVEMIGNGLPVVTSFGAEISYLLVDMAAALGFYPGDAEQLGQHLLAAANSPDLLDDLASNATAYASERLSWEITTASVREWVNSPQYAPDHTSDKRDRTLETIEYEARARVRWALWRLRGAYR